MRYMGGKSRICSRIAENIMQFINGGGYANQLILRDMLCREPSCKVF